MCKITGRHGLPLGWSDIGNRHGVTGTISFFLKGSSETYFCTAGPTLKCRASCLRVTPPFSKASRTAPVLRAKDQ